MNVLVELLPVLLGSTSGIIVGVLILILVYGLIQLWRTLP